MSHWDERQRRMLAEMGIRLALPAVDAAPAPAAAEEGARLEQPSPALSPSLPSGGERSSATRSDIAGFDWRELHDAAASCTACPLHQSRTHPVFGVGSQQAHWMIVGEAPGEQEDLRGEPFVGKSGQLLDNMLRAVGLTRSDQPDSQGQVDPATRVYIANTLKCRPPNNRNPQPEEMVKCEPFLVRQLQLLQPKIILAMGRFAVQSLLRSDEPVGRLRGRVHRYEGVPLVVTYHPAYLLRNPEDKARAWDDLCLALETYRSIG